MRKQLTHGLIALLLASIVITQVPSAPPAEAQDPLTNAAVGFFNILGALNRRNRVYREGRATQSEMDAYYGQLTEAAQQQLLERELNSTDGNQLRVYMRLRAAMLSEQDAVTGQIEAEKNQARQQFNRRVGQELFQVLVRSPGGQSLLGDLRRTVDEVRQATEAVQSAITDNRPFDALAQELADKAGRLPLLRSTAYNLGQLAGRKLDQLLGGVISKVDNAMAEASSGMDEALDEINRIDSELAQFDETERTPVSLVEEGSPLGRIRGVDRANAAADAAAQAYTNAAIMAGALRNPSQAQAESMRSRIRDRLLQDRLDRLSQVGQRARHVQCEGVGRGEYIGAANELGWPLEEPADPGSAGYLVCRDVVSNELISASLVGQAVTQPTPTTDGLAETEEPQAASTVEQGPLPEDRCLLKGDGDFMVENFSSLSESKTCEGEDDESYPFGMPGDPLLLMMAASGKWVVAEETPVETTWEWQQVEALEGAAMAGTAVADGSTLEIDVSIDFGPSNAANPLQPASGNGWALLGLLALSPLSIRLAGGRRRRYLLMAITLLALLLTAQSCDVFGTFTGNYSFPLPQEGFACEVEPDNPNLAEMRGATGQVVMAVTIVDYDDSGNVTSTENCDYTASFNGLGVLKRDGFYTGDDLQ